MVTSMGERMLRAAKLDAAVYEEIEEDRTATGQAVAVVVVVSLATGIGLRAGFQGLIVGLVAGVVAWALWAALIYWIGAKMLPEPTTHADWGELARTLGFATTPGVLRVLGIVPVLGELVFVATGIWMLVATVIAVRHALDYRSLPRAVGVCLIGWVAQMVVFYLLTSMVRPPL
jgi:hypothetical protein